MLFRKVSTEPDGPLRPSHWHEDPNQRTDLNEATLDYPNGDEPPDSPEDYGFPPAESAVPVYLVETPPTDRVYRTWTGGTVGTSTAVQQLASRDRRRKRALIRNTHATVAVTIVRQQTDLSMLGYKLPAGSEVEFFHNDEIWVSSATASEVSWVCEFEVDENGLQN